MSRSPTDGEFDPIGNRWHSSPTFEPLSAEPMVSIIVPSFNQGRYIGETMTSILGQTYAKLEVIVVDGASRDETLDVLASFASDPRVRIISEPDEGVADAVNKGLKLAMGDVIAIQSSDDCYEPDAVAQGVAALRQEQRPGIAYGEVMRVDADGRPIACSALGQYSLERWLTKATYFPQPSTFFRACLIERVGLWNAAYYNCDTEFWLRLIWEAPVVKIDAVLSRRRMHGEQRDNQRAKIAESYSRMIAESAAVRGLPGTLRRAAQAGVWLHRIRYSAPSERRTHREMLWRAVLAYPPLALSLPARHRLVPWGAELLALAGRFRRKVLAWSRT